MGVGRGGSCRGEGVGTEGRIAGVGSIGWRLCRKRVGGGRDRWKVGVSD